MGNGAHEKKSTPDRVRDALDKKRRGEKKRSRTKRQPVLIAAVASLIVWATLQLGLPVDEEVANTIAGVFVTAAVAWVHSKVTPVAAPKLPAESVPEVEVAGDPSAQVTITASDNGGTN